MTNYGLSGGRFRIPADVNGRTSGAVRRAQADARLAAKREANLAKPAHAGRCKRCAAPLDYSPRPQYYCSASCRQAAYRER